MNPFKLLPYYFLKIKFALKVSRGVIGFNFRRHGIIINDLASSDNRLIEGFS